MPITVGPAARYSPIARVKLLGRLLRRSIVSGMNYETTKGAKKHPALFKSAWLQFISLAGLAKYTYRASIEHSCSAGELADKVAVLPLCEISLC